MTQPWHILTPVWSTGNVPARDPESYRKVCEQFDPTHAPDLQPAVWDGKTIRTFCNVYLWRCSRAWGAEIPHFVPSRYDKDLGWLFRELNANDTVEWLHGEGTRTHGWRKVPGDLARDRANHGFPTIAIWKNPSGKSGHVAVCLPTDAAEPEVHTAQAGAVNFFDKRLSAGFGKLASVVEFWTHD